MRGKFLACLLAGFLASNAFATEWVVFSKSANGLAVTAYERSSIRKSSEGILVWFAQINSNPKLPFDLLLSLVTIDCGQGRVRGEQVGLYLRGKNLAEQPGERKWDFPTPGSVAEGLIQFSCSRDSSDLVFKGSDLGELTVWGKRILKKQKNKKSAF